MKLNLFMILLMLLTACDYYDSRLIIQNNSKKDIAFERSPDTIIDKTNKIEFYIRNKIVDREISNQIIPGSTNAWSNYIKNSKNKKLNVFIFEIDTLLKYNDLEYIKKNRLYHRYEYTEEELNKSNWTIQYP